MDYFNSLTLDNLDTGRKVFYYSYINNIYNDELSNLVLKFNEKKYIRLYITHSKGIDKLFFLDYILNSNDSSYMYNTWYDNKEYLPYTHLFLNKMILLKDNRRIGLLLYYYHIVLKLWSEECLKIEKSIFNTIDKDKISNTILNMFENGRSKFNIDTTGFSSKCYKGHNNEIPCMIVCHISNMYEKILYNFYDETSDVSSHYVIGRKGQIKQVVSLDDSSWANGTSLNPESDVYYMLSKNEIVKEKKMNANYFTFSIEHESMDGSLTNEQYNSTIKVMKEIIDYLHKKYNYKFIIDRNHIIGHCDTSPVVRTNCPGEKFPFDKIINDLNQYYSN